MTVTSIPPPTAPTSDRDAASALPRIAYLVPEFPGQTHTWIWRELAWLRRWGAPVRLVSTRPPPPRDRARHAFAAASGETYYLFDPEPLGLARLLLDAALALLARPHRVWAALRLALRLPVAGNRWGRRVLPLIPAAARLAAFCRREAIVHVHCHTCANGALVAMLGQALGGPPYSLCINANLGWWGGAMREKLGGSAFSVSTMRWVAAEVARDFPPSIAAKVHYAPVGVDTEAWRPPATREPLTPRALNLLCVGRLHASKGFDVALAALRRCLDAGVDAHLVLLGDGPERGALTELARRLDLERHVTFAGSVPEDEVRRSMGSADIFLLPSHAEPLGVVVMEAMAMATPVIVTAAGGVGEIVTPGVDALSVSPGDAPALAAAIIELAQDPQGRRTLGLRGRASIVAKFDAHIGARLVFELIHGRDPLAALTFPKPPTPEMTAGPSPASEPQAV